MPEGGNYSGPGILAGMFDPLAVGLGTFTITYTYMDEFDCENFAEAEIIVTSCVGLEDLSGSSLHIYPNPSKGIYNIDIGMNEAVDFEVFNSGGQKIMDATINGKGKIDLSDMPNGVYYLRLNHQDFSKMIQLVLMND
jgi:hypothetical protein